MNIDEFKTLTKNVALALKRYNGDNETSNECYRYGDPGIDGWVRLINPFIKQLYGIELGNIPIQWVFENDEFIAMFVVDRGCRRELTLYYSLYASGANNVPIHIINAKMIDCANEMKRLDAEIADKQAKRNALRQKLERLQLEHGQICIQVANKKE
jgi:hypothetical protein